MDVPTRKEKGTSSLLNPDAHPGNNSPSFSYELLVRALKWLCTAALEGDFWSSLRAGSKEELSRCSFIETSLVGIRNEDDLLEGGLFFFSSVLKAQLFAACNSSMMNPWVRASFCHLEDVNNWECTGKPSERGRCHPGAAGHALAETRGCKQVKYY